MIIFDIITIFPKIFNSFLKESFIKKAQEKGLIKIRIHNLRDFTTDRHKTVDDRPYGGGLGMVIKIEPLYKSVQSLKLKIKNEKLKITKVKEVQEFTEMNKGEEVILTIQRGKEVFDVSLVPRVSPPEGEGPMGVALARTAIKSWPWYQAPIQGIIATANLTLAIIQGWAQALVNAIKGLPTGAQLMGPVGIFDLFTQVSQLGIVYFLQFIAIISIYIALFNILPIPALDGGKLLFLGIEVVRKKPVSQKTEQNITTFFFGLLILLIILVTIKDIMRIF